ncbi:hypothetical protein BZA77DRAFT_34666 [Pyronema omphalodes]|nr:hypothetical protein BZA77DRAFT_34666 [Pyronema omphalodes]
MGAIRSRKTRQLRDSRAIDQVHGDLRNPKQLAQYKALIPDEDRPANGIYHCVECAKFFEQEHNLREHKRGKNHKRRLRMLKEEPYSQKEADAAVGIGGNAFYESMLLKQEEARMAKLKEKEQARLLKQSKLTGMEVEL